MCGSDRKINYTSLGRSAFPVCTAVALLNTLISKRKGSSPSVDGDAAAPPEVTKLKRTISTLN